MNNTPIVLNFNWKECQNKIQKVVLATIKEQVLAVGALDPKLLAPLRIELEELLALTKNLEYRAKGTI